MEWSRHGIVVVEVMLFLRREVRARVVGRKVILFCLLGFGLVSVADKYSWSSSQGIIVHLLQIQKLIWVGLYHSEVVA